MARLDAGAVRFRGLTEQLPRPVLMVSMPALALSGSNHRTSDGHDILGVSESRSKDGAIAEQRTSYARCSRTSGLHNSLSTVTLSFILVVRCRSVRLRLPSSNSSTEC